MPDNRFKKPISYIDNDQNYLNYTPILKNESNLLDKYQNNIKSTKTGSLPKKRKTPEGQDFTTTKGYKIIEAAAKIADPFGVLSYPDVDKAWGDNTFTSADILEPLGALPVLGKFGKVFKEINGLKPDKLAKLSKALQIIDKSDDVKTGYEGVTYKNTNQMKKGGRVKPVSYLDDETFYAGNGGTPKFLQGGFGDFLEENQQSITAGIGAATGIVDSFSGTKSSAQKGAAIGGGIGTAADVAFFGGLPIGSTIGKTLGSLIGSGADRKRQQVQDQHLREADMRDTDVVSLSDDERYGYSPYYEEGGMIDPTKPKKVTSLTTKRGNVITDIDLQKNISSTGIPWESKEQYGNFLDTFAEPIPTKSNSTVTYPFGKRGETMTQDEWDYSRKKRNYPDVYSDKVQGKDNFIPGEIYSNEIRNDIKEYRTKYPAKMEYGGEVSEDYSQEPLAQVNIEKGELLTDQEGNIIREFTNPNRFSAHNKNQYKEPSGNFVELPQGAIVIPKKDAKMFKEGDSITKKSILRNILSQQAQNPMQNDPNIGREETYMEEGGRVPLLSAMNPVDNYDDYAQSLYGRVRYPQLTSVASPGLNTAPIGSAKFINPTTGVPSNTPGNTPAIVAKKNPEDKANLGYYLHEAAPYIAQASNIALANQPDQYLSPEYNNRADDAFNYLNNLDTNYDVSLNLARNQQSLNTASRGLNDNNSPASRVQASEMLGRTLDANNNVIAQKNNIESQLRNQKAGALAQFVNQRGESDRAENIRYQTEQRMNEGSRRSEISGAVNNMAEIAQQQVNSREKIKALNSMSEFHDLDPSRQQMIQEDPKATDRILKLVNAGYSPQMAFKMVLGANVASADNVRTTTTEKTKTGSVRTTTSND